MYTYDRPYRRKRRKGCFLLLILGTALLATGAFLLFRMLSSLLSARTFMWDPLGTGNILDQLFSSSFVVAIDAGHGGSDRGAEGIIIESEMTARTAEDLYTLLEADERFTPVYCHEPDEKMNILDRCEAASRAGADLLISIHGNSDGGSSGHGFECFPAPPGRTYHENSLYFAQLITAQIEATGICIRGDNGIRYAYYMDDVNKYIVESTDNTVRSDGSFGIVDHADCPSVLVEQCFVTDMEDVNLLGDEDGCKLAAEAYYNAICDYYTALYSEEE